LRRAVAAEGGNEERNAPQAQHAVIVVAGAGADDDLGLGIALAQPDVLQALRLHAFHQRVALAFELGVHVEASGFNTPTVRCRSRRPRPPPAG